MQGWDDCASLATPTGTNFTQGPTLIDVRDNKQYEIRKFADGKCWMVDNLMYGGDTDACAGKSTFAGNGSATPSNQFGTGTFGDCRDPRVGGSAPCTAGSTTCGYYYNWQAAMQHETAYYGVTYTGPIINVQGLCPEGWRMPVGGENTQQSDFVNLDILVGGTGQAGQSSGPAFTFFSPGGNFKSGGYYGHVTNMGALSLQGVQGCYFTQTQSSATSGYYYAFGSSWSGVYNNSYWNYGYNVRCLKN